ncbi:hypothetical protein NW761_001437 [Fusarium oxysporum]|nr:hypothetical protein NW758_009765 [Fusarium oxysporum]KAJ4107552.1 hypothetical protein NW761_001437 [Fusarium oxysporum]
MLVITFWRSFAVTLLWLLGLVAAEKLSTPVLWDPDSSTSRTVDEKTMVECGGHIKQCGIMEDIKIVRSPVSTVYVTQNFTTTTEKVLPTQTVVIKSVKVVTVNNQTQGICKKFLWQTQLIRETSGHCRETMTVPDLKPAIITVNVTVEHVREIVPVTNVVSIETSTVTATSIEQCFINNPEPSIHPLVPSSQDPLPVALSSEEPPVALDSEAIKTGDGLVQEIRHERIYEQIGEELSPEQPGFIFQGD